MAVSNELVLAVGMTSAVVAVQIGSLPTMPTCWHRMSDKLLAWEIGGPARMDEDTAPQNAAQSEGKSGTDCGTAGGSNSSHQNAQTSDNIEENDDSSRQSEVCEMEDNGLEPMTYALPARRSPN